MFPTYSEEKFVKSDTAQDSATTQVKYSVEKKPIALYKHSFLRHFHIAVDPQTRDLVSIPSEQLIRFLKESGSRTIKEHIDSGTFKFVCICDIEVKKICNKPVLF